MAVTEKVWKGSDALSDSLVAVDSIRTHPQNPRRGAVEEIARSLDRFGQVRPILVDNGIIIGGNHTYLAAVSLGWTHVAVVENKFATEEEARAFLLADNRTSDLGEYDNSELLAQLKAAEVVGLEGTGYSLDFVAELERDLQKLRDLDAFATPSETPADLDATPDPPTEPTSKLGEVYELGPHRLLCGDARDATLIELLMDGCQAALLWTDPPYGVSYVGKTADALEISGDDALGLPALLAATLPIADAVMEPGAPFYIAVPAGPRELDFRLAVNAVGWRLHQSLAWAKDVFVLGHSDYHYQHENVLYGWKPGPGRSGRGNHSGSRWYGNNAQASVFFVPRPKRSEVHPTMKPVALIGRAIANSSKSGEVVLDPFAGSGSTLIAAEVLGRRAFIADVDPVYCDVVRQRYADFMALPEEQRRIADPAASREVVLTPSEPEYDRLMGTHLEVLRQELGTETVTETVLAACARLARELNLGA